jgi:hypothetical protein
MGRTACTEPQCLYKGALYFTVELYLYSPLWAVRPVQSLSACTRVHLRAGRSGDRIPVGTRFSALVQTGPGAQPAFYTMGIGSLSPGERRPGRGVDHPPLSTAEVKERVEL